MEIVPYISLLLAVILIYVPRIVVAIEQTRQPGGMDNANPRAQQARLTGLGARANGAHSNGFEGFSPFAAGVLACQLRHVPIMHVSILCGVFIIARIVYIALYLGDVPSARSGVWGLGSLSTLGLLVLAIMGA